jgi:hypothetical protein
MSGSINSELKTEQIEVCAHLPKKKKYVQRIYNSITMQVVGRIRR